MLGTQFKFRETFNLRLTTAILVICISQINYGFDNQGYAAIQSIDAFAEHFGQWDPVKQEYYLPSVWLSMFNSFGFLGLFVGVNIGSIVSKRFGRRWCMFSMSCWALVTATITITAKESKQIMVGRVLNYLYTGMELAVVPIFQSEITPKSARGFVVGTYQLMLTLGGLAVQGVCYGTQHRTDESAYRIPFGMFYIVPTFVICTIWFIPESPRWLAIQDRHDDALKSLIKLRKGRFTAEEIEQEFQEVLASLQHEREIEKGSWANMFKGVNKRRTLIVLVVSFLLQATGQSFSSQYGNLFIKSLGTINQFKMQMIQSCINCFVSVVAMVLVDRVGRRWLLLIGGAIQTAALMSMGGLGTVSEPSYQLKSAIVATMVLFVVGYQLGWAPVVHTLSAELPSAQLRDVTYRAGSMVNVFTNFLVAFTLPYLLNAPFANLNSKVGFVYGSIALCSVIFAFLCVPDCRGRSLEDINRLFEAKVPARAFHKVELEPLVAAAGDKVRDVEAAHVEGNDKYDK